MPIVSASEFQRRIGHYTLIARREPVHVTHHGREEFVLVPAEDYHRLRQRDLVVVPTRELPESTMRSMMEANLDHLPVDD
ncbi:MAG TPA: type II toxin-antitoxin system prevent-host-death family antitoxin [Geminicoccaceae bacterium]|nr:type II toxin-antitoxin system prevent-host-death family antitoxin [Geminicoccaceae bacterium]